MMDPIKNEFSHQFSVGLYLSRVSYISITKDPLSEESLKKCILFFQYQGELCFPRETDVFSFLTGPFYIFLKLSRNSVPNSMLKYSNYGVWMMYILFFFSINIPFNFCKKVKFCFSLRKKYFIIELHISLLGQLPISCEMIWSMGHNQWINIF